MKTMMCDVETTGISPVDCRIVEIALLYKDTEKKKVDQYHQYIKYDKYPDVMMRQEDYTEKLVDYDVMATEVSGLTREILEKKGVPEKQAWSETIRFLDRYINKYKQEDKAIFCGYKAIFDERFIREFLQRYNTTKYKIYGSYFYPNCMDVKSTVMLMMSLGLLPLLDNFKLVTVAEHYGIKFDAHTAIGDAIVTRRVNDMMIANFQQAVADQINKNITDNIKAHHEQK